MSYFSETINPKLAWETLGLRRDEARMSDVMMPMLAAFALGIGIGGGAALLLAPQSGRDLRGDLRDRVGKLEHGMRRALPHRAAPDDDSDVDADNGAPSSIT